MQKVQFSIDINAPKEKVWDAMLGDATYREWTSEFHPGSYYEGSWEEGADIRFIGPEADGSKSGMISRIKESRPYEFVSIEHLGMIDHGVDITEGPKVDEWVGMHENYTFTETDGVTTVTVDMDVTPEFKDYMETTWPKALNKLKEIAER